MTIYNNPKMKKVVLAFSGGLDTSYCAVYLSREMGLEVHSVIVNTGGFSSGEIADIEKRAYALGVKTHECIDVRDEYYAKCIKYLVFGNVLKNATYPLSVSAERVFQATAIAEYARKLNADYVCHGSTGAGNDQVRFDMIFNTLIPDIEVIALVREKKLSREVEIDYLRQHGVDYDFKKAEYSINQGIWGTSVGGKETLTSSQTLPEEAYPSQLTKTGSERVTLSFKKGELRGVNGKMYPNPVDAILALQALASPWAVGRDMHVGDTIIGIKGRVGFEAAAPVIIIKAHHTLEKHTLTKWQLFWKDQVAAFYGNHLHEGQYYDPVMRDLEAMMESSQGAVTGEVFVELQPYRFTVVGIESPHDLMSGAFGSYGEMNNAWSGEDVKGFGKIFGLQTMIYHKVNKK